ncbi:MAG: type I restriction enzyme, S subunit [Candidatus Nitrotoga sp. MKT]|nr:MAG: type I restriction enzyme, S subunit [Candidatus Nitrotoga sp. MKT]
MKSGWQTKKLGDLLEVQNGYAFSSKDYSESGHFVMRIGNVQNSFITLTDPKFISLPANSALQRFVLSEGDILVSLTGDVGRVGVIQKKHLPAALNQRVARITIRNSSPASREFLLFFLYSDLFREVLTGAGHGAAQQNVSTKDLIEIQLPVPPLAEQQRIVGILDEAFDGIAAAKANAEKNLQNVRSLFESHLQSVFTQRGEGWREKRLDEVCTFSSGGTPSKSNSGYWSGEIPWISGRDMKSTQLFDSLLHISRSAVDESSTRMAPAGTLLILVRGMGLAHGAQIAELMVPCAFNQDIRAIHPEPGLIPRYLLFALRDRINSSNNVLSSAAHGTLKIDSDELKRVMIPVSSRGHQQRVVATIDSLSEETQRLESIYQRKLAALDNLKKSLLHQAFSGEL